jgi:hypothetical protein
VKEFLRNSSIMTSEERTNEVLCDDHRNARLQARLMYVHTRYLEKT